MDDNKIIVCYTGGTCGDLLVALVDSRHARVTDIGTVMHHNERTCLKKPNIFASDLEKDTYINTIQYNSFPSHDLDYHIRSNHKFISVVVTDQETAKWAANRFKLLHRPHVWKEMCNFSGVSTVDEYAQMLLDYSSMVITKTDQTLDLKRIINGYALLDLAEYVRSPLDSAFYQTWLDKQNRF